LVFFAALKTRIKLERSDEGSKVSGVKPYGYVKVEAHPKPKKDDKPEEKSPKGEVVNK